MEFYQVNIHFLSKIFHIQYLIYIFNIGIFCFRLLESKKKIAILDGGNEKKTRFFVDGIEKKARFYDAGIEKNSSFLMLERKRKHAFCLL